MQNQTECIVKGSGSGLAVCTSEYFARWQRGKQTVAVVGVAGARLMGASDDLKYSRKAAGVPDTHCSLKEIGTL